MEPTALLPGQASGIERRPGRVESAPGDATQDQGAIVHPIELRRLAAGYLSAAAFATAAGVTRNTVTDIEAFSARKPRGVNMEKFATALDVEITVLAREFRNPAGGLLEPQKRIVPAAEESRR